ncbi:MAG TPA: hypothetical protein DCY48_02075 [Candidatus Magasanikbacteria bacterium]|nr:hypothetical protein [Candidatus Magasanikbacteria bacterium]
MARIILKISFSTINKVRLRICICCNMSWLFIAILGYFLLALVFILDKLILTKSVGKPAVYTFYSTIFLFGAVFIFPLVGFEALRGIDWLWAFVSGIAFGLALWTLFIAVKKGEASHINPFNGAAITVGIYLLASFFLGEQLTALQQFGLVVLVLASLILSFGEKTKNHNGMHIGFLWALISGLLFAVSHVSAKYLYALYPFWTGFLWTRATTGFVGLFLLLLPSVRRVVFSHNEKKNKKSKTNGKKYAAVLVVCDKILSVASAVLIQLAAAIGSVTIVGAMGGLQYALLFVFIYILTKTHPHIFKEYFTKKEITLEIIAIALIILGSAMFVL